MKKSLTVLLGLMVLIIQIVLINLVSGAVRINEVELNPDGTDSGNEWIELYSDEEIDLTGWTLKNNNGDILNLTQTFQNYLIINFVGRWLDNSDEKVFLFNNLDLIDETEIMDDSVNDDNTWQYCNENWNFTYMTNGVDNNCTTQSNSDPDPEPEEIYVEVDWDEEDIENGKDFDIVVNVFNLEDRSYDFKIWIEGEEGDDYEDKIISDRYGEDSDGDDEWKSGTYWIYNLFNGPGNKKKNVEIRIREDYENFQGDAILFFKLDFGDEEDEYIEILRKERNQISDSQRGNSQSDSDLMRNAVIQSMQNTTQSIEVISLGKKTEDLKEQSNIIYQSKNELIKKFAIYGFALFCVVLCGLLAFEKLK